MQAEIEKLIQTINAKLDWGSSEQWQSKDFENLSQQILDETQVSLSASTLRRIWGRVPYSHLPSVTTLDALSKFAGFENWRTFAKRNAKESSVMNEPDQPTSQKKWMLKAGVAILLLVLIGLSAFYLINQNNVPASTTDFAFSSEALTREIPNSVIFTYDATAAQTDSVYIQQSWNPRTRALVSKHEHKFTSIYYEPGFYRAGLYLGKYLVKEHPLIIPTEDWLALIENKPTPVYLEQKEFMDSGFLRISAPKITEKNISLQPETPWVKFFNIGNFNPVPVSDFNFSCNVKNEYRSGSAPCGFSSILLVTDDKPISIPLSTKGCTAELSVICTDDMISGRTTDLSGFSGDAGEWNNIICSSDSSHIHFNVNGREVLTVPLRRKELSIVGLAFMFQGGGAVKNIELKGRNKTAFTAFKINK